MDGFPPRHRHHSTGPCFEKYNAVLRGLANPNVKFFFNKYEVLCQGNAYKNTIHLINSALVKLSRLVQATRLYRGMGGMQLPQTFTEDDEYLLAGGTEFGFMSATTDKNAALAYARMREPCIVFEIQQGMVGRGGDLSWLSQYPHVIETVIRSP